MTEQLPVVVRNLSKSFGEVRALDDLSFEARAGQVLGILGPNGAGKTTAIHLILGILRPTSGDVRVLGYSPFTDPYRIYPRINFSSAYVQLPFNLTVERNLHIYASLYGIAGIRQRVSQLLELFQIPHLAKSVTGSLSSGEQTRVNLCKSLLNHPQVLFLDEPTASLDPDMAYSVREILQKIRKEHGVTILYTSHNMAEVEALCDRVLFLYHGRKIVEGSPKEIRSRFQEDSLERVFLRLSRNRHSREGGNLEESFGRLDPRLREGDVSNDRGESA